MEVMDKTADSAQTIPVSYNVYYFSAPWCGPCQVFGPLMDRVAKDYPNANIIKLNIDEEDAQALGFEYGVVSIPHVVTEHAHEIRGAVSEDVLRSWFDYVEAVERSTHELSNSGV